MGKDKLGLEPKTVLDIISAEARRKSLGFPFGASQGMIDAAHAEAILVDRWYGHTMQTGGIGWSVGDRFHIIPREGYSPGEVRCKYRH
jgi:hypothetical protein